MILSTVVIFVIFYKGLGNDPVYSAIYTTIIGLVLGVIGSYLANQIS